MRKYSKILLFAMIAVGMLASSAFAGTMYSNHALVGNYTIASETLGSARAINLSQAGAASANVTNTPVGMTLGTALTAGDLLTLTVTGGKFTAGTYNLCAQNLGASVIMNNSHGSLVVAAATNSITMTIGTATAVAANNMMLSVNACGGSLGGNVPLTVDAGSTGMTVSAVLTASSGAPTKDTFAAVNAVNTVSQYAYNTPTAVNNTIDYLASGSNGSTFTGAGNLASAGAAFNVVIKAADYNATSANLTVGALVSLQDSASWQGVSRVYLVNTLSTCAYANNVIANTTLTGTIGLPVTSGNFAAANVAAAGANFGLCIETATNAVLTPRTITSSQDVVITGTGAVDLAASAYTTINTWIVNSYQGLAPWLINASGAPGYCMINNSGISSATISLNLKSAEAGTLPGTVALGSIAAGKSRTFQFGADSVTEVTTGVTGTPIAITGLTANARYSGLFTVTASPTAIQITCVQTYTTGSRTLVPILVNNAAGTYLTQ